MITVSHGSPYSVWVPVDTSATVYVGSLVCWDVSDTSLVSFEGVIVREQADGIANVTNYDYPFGCVIGTNEKNPRFSTTYKTEYITQGGAADPHDGATREYVGVEGPWSKGDQTAMVKVAVITASTILRAPIYNNAVGTAPTELVITTGSTDGLSATSTTTTDFTPIAGYQTVYCRKGGNAGIYRVDDTASTTAHAWDTAMPADVVIGDVFVKVPVRVGLSKVRFGDNTACSYINCSETPDGNFDNIQVTRLDLREQGKEFAEFFFDPGTLATRST